MLALAAAASILIHVTGSSSGTTTEACFLRIPGRIDGGGSSIYCLKAFHGRRGPNATVTDSGSMTFSLQRGMIKAQVVIVQRYADDGKTARQVLHGTVVSGTRSYRGARGTISGGGIDVEDAPGQISTSNLHYRILLR